MLRCYLIAFIRAFEKHILTYIILYNQAILLMLSDRQVPMLIGVRMERKILIFGLRDLWPVKHSIQTNMSFVVSTEPVLHFGKHKIGNA